MSPTEVADDTVEGLVGFTVVLRSAGLAVTTDRVAAFLSALDALDVTSRTQTYWAGRLTLCSDPDDLPRYDQAFEQWLRTGSAAELYRRWGVEKPVTAS